MNKLSRSIKISENFFSIQGEGRYMGVPSIFLRTFGCNFRCRMFGRTHAPDGESHNPEVKDVITNISKYNSYTDLPLVETGCDSYAAVYPEFKKLSPMMTTDEVAENIINLLPFKEWRDEHLVITGGEPLLIGWQKAYPELLDNTLMTSLKELTFETNGTQQLTPALKEYLKKWAKSPFLYENSEDGSDVNISYRDKTHLTFSVSPKLSCSGESFDEAINPDIICDYESIGYTYLKFVIATDVDATEALAAIELYRKAGFKGHVYLMPVGGVESVYHMNNRQVANLALKHGLRYSDRLQVPLYKNQWGA